MVQLFNNSNFEFNLYSLSLSFVSFETNIKYFFSKTVLNRSRLNMKCLILWRFVFAASVIRWVDYLFNSWPLSKMLIFPIAWNICQSMFKILPNAPLLNTKLSKTLKKFQSGKISPNLIILFAAKSHFWSLCESIFEICQCSPFALLLVLYIVTW